MKKAKLLSLALAAVLLCGCIIGFLTVGASAATVTWTVDGTGGTDTTFATLQAALEVAANTSWASDAELEINISTSTVQVLTRSDDNIVAVPTIWRGNRNPDAGEMEYGNKLPITIRGGAVAVGIGTTSTAAQRRAVFTNDYTFDGVLFNKAYKLSGSTSSITPGGASATRRYYFAGSGNVTIKNTTFGVWSDFFGDNNTLAAYAGWTDGDVAAIKAANDGLIPSSMTLEAVDQLRAGSNSSFSDYGAAGYDSDEADAYAAATAATVAVEVKPSDCKATFDLKENCRVGWFTDADGNAMSIADGKASATSVVNGGQVVYGNKYKTPYGKLIVKVASPHKSIHSHYKDDVGYTGNNLEYHIYTVSRSGNNIFTGGTFSGTVEVNVYNGLSAALSASSASTVTGVVNINYCSGNYNSLSGLFLSNSKASMKGTANITVKSGVKITTFNTYSGNGTYSGGKYAVTVEKGAEIGTFNGGANIVNNTIYGQVGTFYGTNNEGDAVSSVTNVMDGATITGVYYATNTGEIGTVTNRIKKTTFEDETKGIYYGAGKGNVTGNVLNEFGSGNVTANNTGAYMFGAGTGDGFVTGTTTTTFLDLEEGETISLYPRFWAGAEAGEVGDIVVNANDAAFTWFYIGNQTGTAGSTEGNIYDGFRASQRILGGGFSGDNYEQNGDYTVNVYGGSCSSVVAGLKSGHWGTNAETGELYKSYVNIYGGSFTRVYPTSYDSTVKVPNKAHITVNLNDSVSSEIRVTEGFIVSPNIAALEGYVEPTINFVGSETNKLVIGNEFNAAVSSITGTLNIDQTTGWLANTNYITYTGEGNLAELIAVTEAEGVYGDYVIADGVLKGAAAEKVGANLVLTERMAIRFYFNKASVDALGKDKMTFTLTLGDNTLKASKMKEDELGYYFEVAGLSPRDLGEIAYTGNFVYAGTTSLTAILDATIEFAGDNAEGAALVDLCNTIKALGTDELAAYEVKDVAKKYELITNEDSFPFAGVGVVMNDAIGMTVYYTPSESFNINDYTIKLGNGSKASATIDETNGYIDLFVAVADAQKTITVDIQDAEGNSVFKVATTVEYLASAYVDNVDATNILAYIQAANAYQAIKAAA